MLDSGIISWGDEYDTLQPAGDLIGRLQEEISRWLDHPAGWVEPQESDDVRMAALNAVRSGVFAALHDLVKLRLSDQRRTEWQDAYAHSGYRSGVRRANDIRTIYEATAPPISSAMNAPARAFVSEVIAIVKSAVEKAGGKFEAERAA